MESARLEINLEKQGIQGDKQLCKCCKKMVIRCIFQRYWHLKLEQVRSYKYSLVFVPWEAVEDYDKYAHEDIRMI